METPEGDFTIHAQVEGIDTVIFEKIEAERLLLIDTLYAVDGEFVVANTLEGSAFFSLTTLEGNGINLLIENGEELDITGSREGWGRNYTVTGSKGSQLIYELNQKLDAFEIVINAIYEEAKEAQKEDFIEIQDRFNLAFEEHTNFLKSFIDVNIDSKVAILALFQSVKGENILNLQTDYEYYKKVNESFKLKWDKSSHSKLLTNILGLAYAPDFTMENINGDSITLSDYKGKLVLLDFWASWCKPCRLANPQMVALHKEFNEKGLEIISISLDGSPQQNTSKQDWEKAVKEDNLTWTQVSELKGWESEIRNKYDFRSIPYTILIDTDGRIIGQNLDEYSLKTKIDELLNTELN
jgi:thiol-disulfide isomerase/thioredoxin